MMLRPAREALGMLRSMDEIRWLFVGTAAAAHPAVTAVTPAISRVRNLDDHMVEAHGRLPDDAMRRRMTALVDGLSAA
ncbi:MAG TPA: hypothetical protein P5163_05015 [Rubrivivax sp.]|nr:hypothetical protein [Rubrivivax sp.]HRY87840.1 hypothetical protein [Rubrivivax sp.]HRZ59934.1 hypothetical protein [Rubrivivax sp.]